MFVPSLRRRLGSIPPLGFSIGIFHFPGFFQKVHGPQTGKRQTAHRLRKPKRFLTLSVPEFNPFEGTLCSLKGQVD